MKARKWIALLLCATLLLPCVGALAGTKTLKMAVNKVINLKLGTKDGVTVTLQKVTLKDKSMQLYFKTEGTKKHGKLELTDVQVDGKAVREGKEVMNGALHDFFIADNGSSVAFLTNAKMKDVEFTLKVTPWERAKAVNIGTFKLKFTGDFTDVKVQTIALSSLERGDTVTLLNKKGITLKLRSFRYGTERFYGHTTMVFDASLGNTTGKRVSIQVENAMLNKKNWDGGLTGSMNYTTYSSDSLQLVFSDFDADVPARDKLKSGSFSLRVSTEDGDLFYASYKLNVKAAKATPVNASVNAIGEDPAETVQLGKKGKLVLSFAGLKKSEDDRYSFYDALALSIQVKNKTGKDYTISLRSVQVNGVPAASDTFESHAGKTETAELPVYNRRIGGNPEYPRMEDIRTIQFDIMVREPDAESSFAYFGPVIVTIGQ